jgi:TetR/AcrR family transcriptional regulator, transcriptional repressor for nem operon
MQVPPDRNLQHAQPVRFRVTMLIFEGAYLLLVLEQSFRNVYIGRAMARPREFDTDTALDAAIEVFREHGFAGTSAQMLVDAMKIGRQSLYDSFGDKWQLYRTAVRRYGEAERAAHLQALRSGPRAIDGIEAMVRRVVDTAGRPCLGTGSICEFGTSRPDLAEQREPLAHALHTAISTRCSEAQAEGDIPRELDPDAIAEFLMASFTSIRLAARGGAAPRALASLADLALRAVR